MADFPTYQAIPNGDIDPESPITTSLMTLLRDNPIALASNWVFTASTTITIPYSGFYQITAIGGGQGGDGGGDGNGSLLNFGVYAYSGGKTCKQNYTGGTEDCCGGSAGGTTSVKLGATTLISAPGGGSGGSLSTYWGHVFTISGGGYGYIAGNGNPFNGGAGAGTYLGAGGAGGVGYSNGSNGTGYGAGGGGGGGQDGDQATSYGNGGSSGAWGDVLVELTASDTLDITIGAGGSGYSRIHTTGGNGTQGIVFIKWWPDTVSLGL